MESVMNFCEAFLDELAKLADDDSVSSADVDQQEFNPPTPDQPSPSPWQGQDQPVVGPERAGDFSGSDARRELQGMLGSTEGRRSLREAYSGLRSQIDGLVGIRKAFTRGLVRAHREIFGPTSAPQSALRRLLYKEEPFAETESA